VVPVGPQQVGGDLIREGVGQRQQVAADGLLRRFAEFAAGRLTQGVALVGDLAYGRAARSLAMLLALAREVSLVFIAPPATPMGEDVKAYLDARGVRWEATTDLRGALPTVDAVYRTRVQKERFGDDMDAYQAARIYTFTPDMLSTLPEHARILHPLPRVNEIGAEVDADPRAAYFRQAHNGVFVRMALLEWALAHPPRA